MQTLLVWCQAGISAGTRPWHCRTTTNGFEGWQCAKLETISPSTGLTLAISSLFPRTRFAPCVLHITGADCWDYLSTFHISLYNFTTIAKEFFVIVIGNKNLYQESPIIWSFEIAEKPCGSVEKCVQEDGELPSLGLSSILTFLLAMALRYCTSLNLELHFRKKGCSGSI